MTTPTNPPRVNYAPDLFSEHARLAQLGARVLEILSNAPPIREELSDAAALAFQAAVRSDVALLVHGSARSLGLLDAEGGAK